MKIVKVKFNKSHLFKGFYCGRVYGGFPESPLNNPYRIYNYSSVTKVLELFEQYLINAIKTDPAIALAMELLTIDSVLGYWCVNKPVAGVEPFVCHCDVIAKVWAEINAAPNR